MAMAATLVVFGALVGAITWRLRGELQARVLQREAEAIHAVVLMQLAADEPRLTDLAAADATSDAFAAVLESSRLRGVLGVQLFDLAGTLQAALPAGSHADSDTGWTLSAVAKGEPIARFIRRGSLERFAGGLDDGIAGNQRAPLLEIAVPLRSGAGSNTFLGVAHYWIDGAPIARELALMDRGVARQAAVAFFGGAIVIVGVLLWAFRRLDQANRKLRAQSADLARANQELAFTAKTAAIGAISAHLIHGLKNPLAGLEGFVSDGPIAAGDSTQGEAWQMAVDTARRLREMVNEVLAVLRDETGGGADYVVAAADVAAAARRRVADLATAAGVVVNVIAPLGFELSGRSGNLAGLVLGNLLTNAIEASPRGGRVEVELRTADTNVEFHVRDTGTGLSDTARDGLFQPVPSRKKGGGGIGLAISYQLARHAGGQLDLVRSDSTGSVFRLRVPIAQYQKEVILVG